MDFLRQPYSLGIMLDFNVWGSGYMLLVTTAISEQLANQGLCPNFAFADAEVILH